MKNNAKRLLTMLLVVSMLAGTASMPVYAEGDSDFIKKPGITETEEAEETEYPEGVTRETIENEDGTVTELTATKTTEVDGEGNVTVTVIIDKKTEGTDKNGAKVTGSETSREVTESNAKGVEIGGSWVVDGSEKKEWTEEDAGDGGQPEVEVELIPGKKTTGTATKTEIEGDVPADENDKNYDYTKTTTTDRTVNAEVTDTKVTVNETGSGMVGDKEIILTGPAPVYDEDDNVVKDSKGEIINAYGKIGMFDNQYNDGLTSKFADPSKWTGADSMPEDADLRFIGTGEHTTYYAAICYVVYKEDAEGNVVYDEEGKPVIEALYRYNPATHKFDGQGGKNQQLTIDGKPTTELPEDISGLPEYDNSRGIGGNRPTLHAMMDKYGNVIYGYCIDNMVDTKNGDWYTMSNLEDANYYATEDAENHVRNIVLNGYWGTTDVQKEDGTYEDGSIENIKVKLKEAIASGKLNNMVTIPGYEEPVDILEFLDDLTPGEAMIATQAAIWSYSNGSTATQNGVNGYLIVDPDQHANHEKGSSKPDEDILDDFGGARIDFVYKWLMGLDETEDSTVIINEKNFVKDMSLTVKDKAEGHENNADKDTDNDVYNTELNFRLAFVPDPESDDLLVYLIDKDGNTIKDAEGNPIIKRLTENGSENDDYEVITPVDGVYTITGLQLSENENFEFDLRLEGTQLLKKGVYIYESYKGRDVAQNFVGVAEGERNVDVSASMTIKFEVDEDNHVVAERLWHEEGDPEIEIPTDPQPEPEVPQPEPQPEPDPEPQPEPQPEPEENEPEAVEEEPETVEEEPAVTEETVESEEIAEEPVVVEEPVEEIVIIEDEDIPLTDIPDEPVPLTADSFAWYIVSALAGLALAAVSFFDRKKKQDA